MSPKRAPVKCSGVKPKRPAPAPRPFVAAATILSRKAFPTMLFGRRKRFITRILIVEDEPLVAFDNESSLSADGYVVVATVDRCADAIAAIDAEPLDLVLTDIALAGERTGLDVARYAATKGVPVLFVSGACPPEARALGVGHLAKPYNDRTLKAALDHLDRLLGGDKPGRLPPGLTIHGAADSAR